MDAAGAAGLPGGPRKTAASKADGMKPKIPLPGKRGSSLNPARVKTQSEPELGGIKGLLGAKGRGETPTAAGDSSTAFSKRTAATGGFKASNDDLEPSVRPSTEFIPSASQDFGEKIRQGRLRPNR